MHLKHKYSEELVKPAKKEKKKKKKKKEREKHPASY
jgi:hypothetical protein